MASVEQRVKKVISHTLKVSADKINLEDNISADLGADSTQSIELVAALEEEFGIMMDEDDALACDTVVKAVVYITKACKKAGKKI